MLELNKRTEQVAHLKEARLFILLFDQEQM